MFIERSNVGKKIKYYLATSYRDNGKIRKIRRYLGENLTPVQIKQKKTIAEKFLKNQLYEVRKQKDPLKYALNEDELNYINKLIKTADITNKKLTIKEWQKFYNSFAYNTNAIEGSRLEQKEVNELFEKEKWPKNKSKEDIAEALGIEEALNFCRKTKKHLSIDLIKGLHYIVFKNSKEFAGTLRKENVVVVDGNNTVVHRGAPPQQLESLLSELVDWYKKNKRKYHSVVLAGIVHNQFENIHPFADGNGRVGRLLLNNVLLKHKLPPLIITYEGRGEYYSTLQEFQKQNNLMPTIKFMLKMYKGTFKEIK